MGINEDMENISERTSIRVSVRDLVEFVLRSGDIDNRHKDGPSDLIAMQEGSRIHRMIQKRMGADYRAEVPLRVCVPMDEYDVIIEGRADGIIGSGAKDKPKDLKAEDTGRVTIDEIKSTHTELDLLKEPKPVHLAQAKCYAYIFLNENGLDEIGVRMTYCNADTLEIKYFHETYTSPEIRKWFDKVIKLYKRWTDFEFNWKRSRNASIEGLEFPFDYREGQRQLMGSVYHCIRAGERMFIQAPTGTGKTVATVFPSVKAMGEGLLDKIFYLTAKNQVDGDYGRYFLSKGVMLHEVDALLKQVAKTEKFEMFDEKVAENVYRKREAYI